MFRESSVIRAEREQAAMKELQELIKQKRRMSIAEVAAVSQKHQADPASILRILEHSRGCTVDWQAQEVVCR